MQLALSAITAKSRRDEEFAAADHIRSASPSAAARRRVAARRSRWADRSCRDPSSRRGPWRRWVWVRVTAVEVVFRHGVHEEAQAAVVHEHGAGVGALYAVHAVVDHGEVRAVQQAFDGVKVEDTLQQVHLGLAVEDLTSPRHCRSSTHLGDPCQAGRCPGTPRRCCTPKWSSCSRRWRSLRSQARGPRK